MCSVGVGSVRSVGCGCKECGGEERMNKKNRVPSTTNGQRVAVGMRESVCVWSTGVEKRWVGEEGCCVYTVPRA